MSFVIDAPCSASLYLAPVSILLSLVFLKVIRFASFFLIKKALVLWRKIQFYQQHVNSSFFFFTLLVFFFKDCCIEKLLRYLTLTWFRSLKTYTAPFESWLSQSRSRRSVSEMLGYNGRFFLFIFLFFSLAGKMPTRCFHAKNYFWIVIPECFLKWVIIISNFYVNLFCNIQLKNLIKLNLITIFTLLKSSKLFGLIY